jgi:pimeloyl-ACP methyl ester carboxylesterase
MTNVFSSIDARVDVVRGYRPIEELIPRHWQEGDVEANGIRQHFLRTGGSGPALVLLHGCMEGAIAWLPVARALESEYDVVMFDARGHGRSPPAGGHLEPEILAEDVATALASEIICCASKSGFSIQSSGPLTVREEPSPNANVRVLRFENTGHLIHRDRFDAFIDNVRSFLRRNERRFSDIP